MLFMMWPLLQIQEGKSSFFSRIVNAPTSSLSTASIFNFFSVRPSSSLLRQKHLSLVKTQKQYAVVLLCKKLICWITYLGQVLFKCKIHFQYFFAVLEILQLTLFQLCVSKIFTQKTAYFTVSLIIFLHDSLIVNIVSLIHKQKILIMPIVFLFFCFFWCCYFVGHIIFQPLLQRMFVL